MFSPTPRQLRLCTVTTVTTVTCILATLMLAIAFAGQPGQRAPSSSLAMKTTAYRVSINDVPQQFIVDRDLEAQAAGRRLGLGLTIDDEMFRHIVDRNTVGRGSHRQ